jgi:hypothetical protein
MKGGRELLDDGEPRPLDDHHRSVGCGGQINMMERNDRGRRGSAKAGTW